MSELQDSLEEFIQLMSGLAEENTLGRYRAQLFLADCSQDLFRSAYSLGMTIEDCFPYYMKWLKYVTGSLREDEENIEGVLCEAVDLFSIGVFYEDRKEEFIEELAFLQSRTPFDDGMLNLCYSYLGLKTGRESKSALKYLNKWLMGRDEKAPISKSILNDWYRCNKEAVWYDAHKADNNLYTGYWSFELGALAKILKLDDKDFEGNIKYYPYDLVHFTK